MFLPNYCLVVRPAGVYPLDRKNGGRDISGNRNPTAFLSNVKRTRGPKGRPDGALSFPGKPVGYVKIPNRGGLATRGDLTYMAWVYPTGGFGIIISHGLTLKVDRYKRLVLYINRFLSVRSRRRLRKRRWNLVAVTFRRRTYESKVYVKGQAWIRHSFGRRQPFTRRSVYIGGKPGARSGFMGRITCVQFFKKYLTARQIIRAGKRCIRRFPIKYSLMF